MSDINSFGPGSQIALPDEQQAPPYVLHPHGPPAAEIESLPIYTAQHDPNTPITIQELNTVLGIPNRIKENDVKVWQRYIAGLGGKQTDEEKTVAERSTIMHYFSAIKAGQENLISLLIESNLVTASTKMDGKTPLLEAVLNKNVRVAQQLIEFGADPNEFGSPVS
jgi:ankyrin repeat protein